ncbi:hypothetical protein PV797_03450 [Clostridiaceae bacterium M8S5]|nr:hypothetical protein PV797_03450 [Clostridiaceae bacterium M8S5]
MKSLKKSKKVENTLFVNIDCFCGCWPSNERIDNKLELLWKEAGV